MERREIEALYRRMGPLVHRRALAILDNTDEATDVLQDVFVAALSKGASFRGDSAPVTWLYSITTNLCLNRLRNRGRRARILASITPSDGAAAGPSPETLRALREILGRLPDQQAQAAVFYYLDEMTHEEMAPLLGCSRRQVGRLLARVAQKVQDEGGADEARP